MSDETLTIIMTDRRPVTINLAEWPLVSEAQIHQSWAGIRQHDDGRMLIYGHTKPTPDWFTSRVGYIEAKAERYAHYLSLIEMQLGAHGLANAVLARMPPEFI